LPSDTGFCTNVFVLRNKTGAFKKKLAVWDSFVLKGDTEMFSTITVFLTNVDVIAKDLSDITNQRAQDFDYIFYDFDYIFFLKIRILEMKPYKTVLVNKMLSDCDNLMF